MSNNLLTIGVVLAIVIAGAAFFGAHSGNSKTGFGSATNCTDGYTCFTNLETQGNSVVDGTSSLTATTTLSDTVNFNNPGICLNFFATSTDTRLHMVASSTSLVNGVATGVMLIAYGACAL